VTEKKRNTFIGIPSHNGQVHGDIIASVMDPAIKGETIGFAHQAFSLLARNFNDLFCFAINQKIYTHFLLLHSDMIPLPGWLGRMHEIMAEKKCDVLSVVAPRKNPRGLTSTAVLTGMNPFRARCLSMKEIQALPETFGDEDLQSSRPAKEDLLVNSGCLLIDLSAPWVGKVWFEIKDDVVKTPEGAYKPAGISEDWLFSMRARAAGAKIYATRAVKVIHVGTHGYTNDPADWAGL
jgi:GT2 family glycosyltransferase